MASITNAVKSFITGRTKVGLTGSGETIDLDIVESFVVTHNNIVTSHPIEKDPKNDTFSNITDHVNPNIPTIKVSAILSTNIISRITAKEKLEKLLQWQSIGMILKIEGYGTGNGIAGDVLKKIFSILDKGWGSLYDSDLKDPHYVGIDTDIIKNVVIGNIAVTRKTDLGEDIEFTFDLQRINFAEPETYTPGQTTTIKNNPVAGKGETPPKPAKPEKVKSDVKKFKAPEVKK